MMAIIMIFINFLMFLMLSKNRVKMAILEKVRMMAREMINIIAAFHIRTVLVETSSVSDEKHLDFQIIKTRRRKPARELGCENIE